MAFLIDTSVAIALERQGKSVEAIQERMGSDAVAVAAITASELLHGVHRADTAVRRDRRLRHIEDILDAVTVLPFDLDTARIHSRIWADLATRGQLIGPHDLIIAATALAHELAVGTLNRDHFGRIDGLEVIPW